MDKTTLQHLADDLWGVASASAPQVQALQAIPPEGMQAALEIIQLQAETVRCKVAELRAAIATLPELPMG